ncbi:MAG TPA: penicillin acylase family protein, partial [Acidobacteriota bacterium]
MRWLLRVVVALLLFIVVAAGFLLYTIRRSFPQISSEIRVSGLSEPVEVIRDRFGVPHIYASNSNDLFFAQGYIHAQDRFWQM